MLATLCLLNKEIMMISPEAEFGFLGGQRVVFNIHIYQKVNGKIESCTTLLLRPPTNNGFKNVNHMLSLGSMQAETSPLYFAFQTDSGNF